MKIPRNFEDTHDLVIEYDYEYFQGDEESEEDPDW